MTEASLRYILCADDFAQNNAISDAILDLAEHRRLSAISAMVTCAAWASNAAAAAALRDRVAVGLHLNLTHGAPLGPMPRLAPEGRLPGVGALILASLTGRLDSGEIGAEIERQFEAFEAQSGFAPDHVDGHQHVHCLPVIRAALFALLARRYPGRPMLLRVPSDRAGAILRRPHAQKAALVAMLAVGFAKRARQSGYATNTGFAGFSDYADSAYGAEFDCNLRHPGRKPMVMCHPGMDGSTNDPIAARRPQEYAFLRAHSGLEGLIWHPTRTAPAAPVDWASDGGTHV